MTRLLALLALTTVVLFGAACGDDDDFNETDDGSTPRVGTEIQIGESTVDKVEFSTDSGDRCVLIRGTRNVGDADMALALWCAEGTR